MLSLFIKAHILGEVTVGQEEQVKPQRAPLAHTHAALGMAFALSTEDQAVLDEVLAFVAAWEDHSDETSSDSSAPQCGTTPARSTSARRQQRVPARKAARTWRTPPKTLATELIELRQQVALLKTRLARLEKSRGRTRTSDSGRHALLHNDDGSVSRTRVPDSEKQVQEMPPEHVHDAIEALEQLQKSETLNAKLKCAIAVYEKISKRIQSIFLKQTAKRHLAYLLELEMRSPHDYIPNDQAVREKARVIQALYCVLAANYHETTRVMAAINARDTRCVFSTSGVTQTPMHGTVFEVSTNTPVPCSLQQLDHYMWSRLGIVMGGIGAAGSTQKRGRLAQNFHEKQIQMSFPSQSGEIYVEGVSMLRKFVDEGRTGVLVASKLTVAGTDLLFRENLWAILSDITAVDAEDSKYRVPRPQTLAQTHYQVSYERAVVGSGATAANVRDGRVDYIQGYVQHALSERMRELQLHIQSVLTQDFASIQAGGVLELPRFLVASAPCEIQTAS
ncbi:hypothetical protein FI667_g16882, partial [Globisporangium splendens]